jgi:hypothetical protein
MTRSSSQAAAGSVVFRFNRSDSLHFRLCGRMSARAKHEIEERAQNIRGLGRWVGFFEWLVWGELRNARILILFGREVFQLREIMGFPLPPRGHLETHRVGAVILNDGKWRSAVVPRADGELPCVPVVNHFVIGKPFKGARACQSPGAPDSALAAAASAGWLLCETNATGDCGPDVMAHFAQRERCPTVWKAIRAEIADFMMTVSGDEMWQDCFALCSELGRGAAEAPRPRAPPAMLAFGIDKASSPAASSSSCPHDLSGGLGPRSVPDLPRRPAPLPPPLEEDHSLDVALSAVASSAPVTFVQWLKGLPHDLLNDVTKDYYSFKEAEDRWRAVALRGRPAAKPLPRRKHASTRVTFKLATGLAYLAWKKDEGANCKAPLKDFLVKVRRYTGRPPKKDRTWLRTAAAAAEEHEAEGRSLIKKGAAGGKKPSLATSRVPEQCLLRRRKNQGPPYKAPLVREMLWDWFVDIRKSLATTISPKFVLLKARQIADSILKEQRRLGNIEPMPVIDKDWLRRWKRDKGVVFRKPNLRFKCSKTMLLGRLRAMWLNTIRVRRLAQRLFGNDLSKSMYGIDEKPIHFNESGSKNTRTLEIAGAPAVRLKQNHAATRQRVSLMTCVTSSPNAASQPRCLPLEALFKAKSEKRTRSVKPPDDVNMRVRWAEKGSYRQENLEQYLETWLDPWTPLRQRQCDYRILYMDVARSHVADEVQDLAWSRGYVPLYHYGHTTGVAQVNDTDCHADFQRIYLEFEQAAFNEQQLLEPGNINRTVADVVNDAAATWKQLNHQQGVSGHKRNGLSNNLDGSEDHLISRQARLCWLELDMPSERLRAIQEVDDKYDSGEITCMADWRKLVVHPDDPGILHDEGDEFEGFFL